VLVSHGLTQSFGKGDGLVRAVDEVDLEVRAAETVAVMGPSGCGKSTLLHLLGGLERPSGGEVVLAGSRLDQMGERALARLRRTAIGFVFQAFHLMDELTARENVELPALLAGRSPRAARRHASELLERVGLGDRAGFLPAALSGGQRQRVAIAQAMAKGARILVLDEATSALDSESEHLVQEALWRLMENSTAVVIAHRLSTIAHMDRIVVLDRGAIVEEGTHSQLLDQDGLGLYSRLWRHQSGGFLVE
jgi:putative ABC transport system ATP-binding protein